MPTKRITATGSQAIDIGRGTGGNTPVRQKQSVTEHNEMNSVLSTRAAFLFTEEYPEYYGCPENSKKMIDYVSEHQLDPYLVSSWSQAFQSLTLAGALLTPPGETGETVNEFQPRRTEYHMDGSVRSYVDPAEVEELKKLDLKQLKKIVETETAKKRADYQRRGIRV